MRIMCTVGANRHYTPNMAARQSNTLVLYSQYKAWMKSNDGGDHIILMNPDNLSKWYALLFFDEAPPAGASAKVADEYALYGAEVLYEFNIPKEFPNLPPGLTCITANGQMAVGGRICLGIGEFHPEAWQPSLGMCGFIRYVASCMKNFKVVEYGFGLIKNTSPSELRVHAAASREYNRTCNKAIADRFEAFCSGESSQKLKAVQRLLAMREAYRKSRSIPPSRSINLPISMSAKPASATVQLEAPVVQDAPVVQEAPVVLKEPVVQAQLVVQEAPVVLEAPVVQDAPVVLEEPVVQAQPVVQEAPVVHAQPVAPIMKVPTPIKKVPTPIKKVPTPIKKVPTPIKQVPAPIKQVPAPIKQAPELPPEHSMHAYAGAAIEVLSRPPSADMVLTPASSSAASVDSLSDIDFGDILDELLL
jgi:hypothetical protein